MNHQLSYGTTMHETRDDELRPKTVRTFRALCTCSWKIEQPTSELLRMEVREHLRSTKWEAESA